MARTDAVQLMEESRLFEQLYPGLRRFAAVVGPTESDPDDLLQEAVARVLRHHRLTELNDPGPYLRRTIVNLAANQRRQFARMRRALGRLGAGATQARDPYPSDLAELTELPPRERAVLYLAEVEGYRYAEIGRMLDCTEVAARKRALRARRRLHAVIVREVASG